MSHLAKLPPSSPLSKPPLSPAQNHQHPTNTFKKRISSVSQCLNAKISSQYSCHFTLYNYLPVSYSWHLSIEEGSGMRSEFSCREEEYRELCGAGLKATRSKSNMRNAKRRSVSQRSMTPSSVSLRSGAHSPAPLISPQDLFASIRDALFGLKPLLRFRIFFVKGTTKQEDLTSAQFRKSLKKRHLRKKVSDKLLVKVWSKHSDGDESPIGLKQIWLLLAPQHESLSMQRKPTPEPSLLPNISSSPPSPVQRSSSPTQRPATSFASSPPRRTPLPRRSTSSLAFTLPSRTSSPLRRFSLQHSPINSKKPKSFSKSSQLRKSKTGSSGTKSSPLRRSISSSPLPPQSPTSESQFPPPEMSDMLQLIEAYFRVDYANTFVPQSRSSSPTILQHSPPRVSEPLTSFTTPFRHHDSIHHPSSPTYMISSPLVSPNSPSRNYRFIAENMAAKNPRTREIMTHLQRVDQWDFDVFALDQLIGSENLLVYVAYALFLRYGLLTKFQIRDGTFINFIKQIERSYQTNPYHNVLHAVDSLHMIHYVTSAGMMREYLADEDILVALLSPIILDSSYLLEEKERREQQVGHSHLGDPSDAAFQRLCTHNANIFAGMTDEQQAEILSSISTVLLATDRSHHTTILHNLRSRIEMQADFSTKENVLLILQATLRLSDLAYTMKPRKLYLKWTERVFFEYHLRSSPSAPRSWDAQKHYLAKAQMGLINYLVSPLLEVYCELLPRMRIALSSLTQNKYYWLSVQQQM